MGRIRWLRGDAGLRSVQWSSGQLLTKQCVWVVVVLQMKGIGEENTLTCVWIRFDVIQFLINSINLFKFFLGENSIRDLY